MGPRRHPAEPMNPAQDRLTNKASGAGHQATGFSPRRRAAADLAREGCLRPSAFRLTATVGHRSIIAISYLLTKNVPPSRLRRGDEKKGMGWGGGSVPVADGHFG